MMLEATAIGLAYSLSNPLCMCAGEPNRGTVTQRVHAPTRMTECRIGGRRVAEVGIGPNLSSFLVLSHLLPNAQRAGNKLSLSVCCGAGLQYCQVSDSQPSNIIEVIGEELGSQPSNIIVVIQRRAEKGQKKKEDPLVKHQNIE